MKRPLVCAFSLLAACGSHVGNPASSSFPPLRSIALPGAPAEGVLMDYLAVDRARQRVWVPAGNTGNVDVIDAGDHVTPVAGFATAEMERRGKKRRVGPSSATVGEGVVYVGNRADSSVCAIDATSLQLGVCTKLDAMPDGIAYVAATKEVWVTTPSAKTLVLLDASKPGALPVAGTIVVAGEPEGYVVDDDRGIFYTNLEDNDRTLAIDVRTHDLKATWMPDCGSEGPKGLALDHARDFLFVACTDHVRVLDAGNGGKLTATIPTGAGVDNLDYLESRHTLYAAAGRAGTLTLAVIAVDGHPSSVLSRPTAAGARNAVVSSDGTAYLTHSAGGRILVAPAARP